jgi:hypothetical protein
MREGFLRYLFGIDVVNSGKRLLGTVAAVWVDPKAKALSEGRAAAAAFVSQGSDLIIGQGTRVAMVSAEAADGGLAVFGAGQGGWSRYDTGSSVDVDGFSLMTGLVGRKHFGAGRVFHAGAFLEAGWGGYDSFNAFPGAESVRGSGDVRYLGAGGLLRFGTPGGFYADASVRAGRVKTSFSSSDLLSLSGRMASYSVDSSYLGAHLGLGYVLSLGGWTSLDLSFRYIMTRQGAGSDTVLGDNIAFDSVDSRRLRGGARLSLTAGGKVSPYLGAYYERELDGKVRASDNGLAIGVPDFTGGTGIGELGLSLTPAADSGLSLDIGVQGYAGVRKGVTGRLQLKWEF